KYFSNRETVWTGCPCNAQRPAAPKHVLLKQFSLGSDRLTILVLGGSQGSRFLNEVFFEAVPYVQADQNIQLIHATGKADHSLYAGKYSSMNVPHYVCPFLDNIQDAYGAADIVVSRSGAATVCELASFGLPSVLVPYPFAHSHQTANARVLEGARAAVVIEQKDLSPRKLVEAIRHLQEEGLTPPEMRDRVAHLFVNNPVERLVQAIMSLKR
ncbi:MAG: UDP-N-acetylglucosamine--N-acetylmuramyl-(pentapeptide) pyrophosphoryl-undecaprenol N-acetylglucosamine transferase, partial [Patescibacteria group bacterium]